MINNPHPASLFKGRQYHEWVPTLDQLRSEGRDEEAIEILLGCRDAAERHAAAEGWGFPAPAYTRRLAIIYRRNKDYAREVEVLQRYLSFGPEAATHSGFVGRLAKARELHARQNDDS